MEVEVTLIMDGTYSPVIYDLTVKNLDSNTSAADLGVTITGDKNSLNRGDTVKLTITAFNNGPNSANVKVNYKIPFGLKLLSSQGQGVYDPDTGVWSVGVLGAAGDATVDFVLQGVNSGYILNVATVYSDLLDLNLGDNQESVNLIVNAPNVENIPSNELNTLLYVFSPDIGPIIPIGGGGSGGSGESDGSGGNSGGSNGSSSPGNPSTFPNTQLGRDISWIRGTLSSVDLFRDYSGSSGTFDDQDSPVNILPMPEWDLNPFDQSIQPTDEELKNWESLLIGFGTELLLYGASVFVPNEWLREVQNGFTRVFSTFGKIAKYFGYEKQANQIANLLKRGHTEINDPNVIKWNDRLSAVLDGLGPNVGMKILEKLACKLFPGAATETKIFLNAFSIVQFCLDPFGTLNAIINAGRSLFAKIIPDPKDLMEILIADPLKWIL